MKVPFRLVSGVSGVAIAAALVFTPGSPISMSDASAGGKPPMTPKEIKDVGVDVDRQIRVMGPHMWAKVSGTSEVSASVGTHDDVGSVMFAATDFENRRSYVIGTDTDGSDGWSVPWDTTGLANGECGLSVIAFDGNGGQIGVGRGIFVDVAN